MAVAQLFLDARGLTGEQGPPRLKPGDLSVAENVSFTNLLEKEHGTLRLTPVALGAGIRAGFDWWPQPLVQRRVVATADGRLLKDDMTGSFATTLKSGLAADRIVGMAEGGGEAAGSSRKLFITNGFDPPQVLAADLSTTTDLATPAADWSVTNHYQPAGMFGFRGVTMAFGNANRLHALYGSLGSDHEDYASAGTFILNVFPGQGERIAAGLTAIGRCFVFKYPQGIYFIDDSAATISGWFILPITNTYGVPLTPHAIDQVDQSTVAFLNANGAPIFMEETFATLTGIRFVDLFKALNFRQSARALFDPTRMAQSQLRWDDEQKQLHATYSAIGATSQTRRLVIDFNGERTRVSISSLCGADALWIERAGATTVPVAGDATGVLRRLGEEARLVDGLPYPMRVVTTPTDYSSQDPRFAGLKDFTWLHVEYVPMDPVDLLIHHLLDDRDVGHATVRLRGAGLPHTDVPSPRLASVQLGGTGVYHSLAFDHAGPENIRISRAFVEFEPKGLQR